MNFKKYRGRILLFFLIFILPYCVYAEDITTYEKGSIIDLTMNCINNGSFCSEAAVCNITITYPNSSVVIDEQNMTNNGAYFNYTLLDSGALGGYRAMVLCCDGYFCDYTTFNFEITNDGFDFVNNTLAIVLTSIIMILFFLGMGIITTHDSILATYTRWGSMCLAFLQLVFIVGVIFVNQGHGDIAGLLKINFYITGFIGFGLFVVSAYLKTIEMITPDPDYNPKNSVKRDKDWGKKW